MKIFQANIVRYNEETLKKMYKSTYAHADSVNQLSDNFWRETSSSKAEESGEPLSLTSAANDLDMPTPPLALARVSQHGIRLVSPKVFFFFFNYFISHDCKKPFSFLYHDSRGKLLIDDRTFNVFSVSNKLIFEILP